MLVLGVDVGVIHFALCLCEVQDREHVTILRATLVNLMSPLLGHETCSLHECPLSHSKMNCDRVDHLIQCCREEYFDVADSIVIEQQPLGGMKDIEQLLVKQFRSRSRLVSPIRLHRWLGIGRHVDYEERKKKQEAAAIRLGFGCSEPDPFQPCSSNTCCLIHRTGLTQWYVSPDEQRTHDMADAYLLVCFAASHPISRTEWYESGPVDAETPPVDAETPPPPVDTTALAASTIAFFESFRYHPRPYTRRWEILRIGSLVQSSLSE